MTDVRDAEAADTDPERCASEQRDFEALGRARLAQLDRWVMPPGHEPVSEYLMSIWMDGLTAGVQMDGEATSVAAAKQRLAEALPDSLYARLESAEVFTEFDEFPELNDRDFEDLSIDTVSKLVRQIQPDGHPEVSAYAAAIWVDGLATALRVTRATG